MARLHQRQPITDTDLAGFNRMTRTPTVCV
jgi:hypothetical protein